MKSNIPARTVLPTDLQALDELIRNHVRQLLAKPDKTAKLGDLLKMIELRYKLAPGDQAQQEFWAMLEEVRQEVLAYDRADPPDSKATVTKRTKTSKGKK